MAEGWHAAEMILTVQVAEKMKLEAQTMASPPTSRTAVLYSRATQAPMAMAIPSSPVRFGGFEVDLRSGELHKQGIKIKLHDQPFQVLAALLEHPGELVTREHLHQKLWPADTFVDFDVGLNSAIKRLRDALGDSAEEPRYIETLPRRGYRFIARVENGALPASAAVEENLAPVLPLGPTPEFRTKRRFVVAAGVAAYHCCRSCCVARLLRSARADRERRNPPGELRQQDRGSHLRQLSGQSPRSRPGVGLRVSSHANSDEAADGCNTTQTVPSPGCVAVNNQGSDQKAFFIQSAEESFDFAVRLRVMRLRQPVLDAQTTAGLLEPRLPLGVKSMAHRP